MEMIVALPWLLSGAVLVSFLLVLRWFLRRPRNLPPGPWELPLLGSLPAVVWGMKKGLEPHHVLGRFAERYGPVFCVTLFNKTVVILDDFESSRAAFRHPDLSDRPAGMGVGEL